MDELTKLQNDYVFFEDMFETIERKEKTQATDCKNDARTYEMQMTFDAIDQGKV